MSGYLHGGSALTLDIGCRNGTHAGGAAQFAPTAFVPGDWVAISGGPNNDGSYEVCRVAAVSANAQQAAQCILPVGVVLGPRGMSFAAGSAAGANDGSEFMIRVKGVVTANVTAGGALTAPVPLNRVNDQLHAAATAGTNFIATAAHAQDWGVLGCGVLMSDHSGAAGVERLQVYVTNNRL